MGNATISDPLSSFQHANDGILLMFCLESLNHNSSLPKQHSHSGPSKMPNLLLVKVPSQLRSAHHLKQRQALTNPMKAPINKLQAQVLKEPEILALISSYLICHTYHSLDSAHDCNSYSNCPVKKLNVLITSHMPKGFCLLSPARTLEL